MQKIKQQSLIYFHRLGAFLAKSKFLQPSRLRSALGRLWYSIGGDTAFCFTAIIDSTEFRMCGPYRICASDYYHNYLRYGAYEAAVTIHIKKLVDNYKYVRILDIGAHDGWYTLFLARLMGDRGKIFAIEPSEKIFSILKHNVELNAQTNVVLYMIPLSDKHEAVDMVNSKVTPWECRYMLTTLENDTKRLDIPKAYAIPFDELNEKEDIHPNIVKIDVHGVWKKVVDGMKESLRKDIEHLYLEIDTHTWDISNRYEDLLHVFSLLKEAGMNIYEIQNFKEFHKSNIVIADAKRIASHKDDAILYAVKN